MKKFVAVLSAAAMMTSLAACGYTADNKNFHILPPIHKIKPRTAFWLPA